MTIQPTDFARALTHEASDLLGAIADSVRRLQAIHVLLAASFQDAEASAATAPREATAAEETSPRVLSFPPFLLDLENYALSRGGVELALRPKPFAILRYLVEHPQRLVPKRELIEAIWGKVVTSDSLLRTHIRKLRQVLGAEVIETANGRGYRFVPKVTRAPAPAKGTPRSSAGTRDGSR